MSRVVIREIRRQLELEALYQLVCEAVQPQEQTRFQAEGIQLVEAPNNEPQQLGTRKIPFHQIPT
jgi:hypothetical protein